MSLVIASALTARLSGVANSIAPATFANPDIDTRFRSKRKGKGRGFAKTGYGNRQHAIPRDGERERLRRVGQRLGFCGQRAIEEGERYLLNHNRYVERAA